MNYLKSKITAKFVVFFTVVMVVFWSVPCNIAFGEVQEGSELLNTSGSEQSETIEEAAETTTEKTDEVSTEKTEEATTETAIETVTEETVKTAADTTNTEITLSPDTTLSDTKQLETIDTKAETTTKTTAGTTVEETAETEADKIDTETTLLSDKTPPVITIIGDNPVVIKLGSTYADAGTTAIDDVDGDLTGFVKVLNMVDTTVLGSYKVTYNVSDKAGNAAAEVTRIVNVVNDLVPPVITIIGASQVMVKLGSVYTDTGATATDDVDGDLTSSIKIVNTVDTTAAGSYKVTYNVSDKAGNAAAEVTRIVNVVGEPTVTTDKDDYSPGEIVVVTGSGWLPGETVKLDFVILPLQLAVTCYAIADGEGNIYNNEYMIFEHHLGQTVILTATGQTTGLSAMTVFTDSPKIGSVTISAQSPNPVYPTNNARYTITINRGSGSGSFYADLSVTTPLPDGCTASFSSSHIYFSSTRNSATSTLTIRTTSGTTPAGITSFTIRAEVSGTPGDYATVDGTLTVGGIGSVTAGSQSPNPVYTPNGATYTVTVNRSGIGPFSADLSITTALPDGCTASFNPSTVSFSSGDASKTSTLTISTSGSTPAGSTSFTIQAVNSGNPNDYKTRDVILVVASYTDTPQIGSVTVGNQSPNPVYPTNNARYTITITRGTGKGSFYADLSVITPLPPGCTASFSSNHIYFSSTRNSATSTLTIRTTSGTTPAGTKSFTVQAVNSGYSGDYATGDGTLTVGGIGSVTAGSQSPNPVYASNSATYTVTVTCSGIGPFSADLSITTALPDGCTASFNPSTVSFSSGDASKTSILTISTSGSTPAGSTSFTIQAVNSGNPNDYRTRGRTLAVVRDITAPTVTLAAYLPDPTSDNTPTYSGSAADARLNIVDIEYNVDSSSWIDVDVFTPGKNVSFTFTTSALTDGVHTIYVKAYDAAGNASSTASDTLTVGTSPAITDQPSSATKTIGESVTFSVTANGTAPLSYQWSKDGANISGATSSSYTILSVALSDAGSYDVVVSNAYGSAISDTAILTVTAATTNLSVSSASGTYGGTVDLSATLTPAVCGKTISFTLNGSSVGSATTDASGVAELNDISLSGIDAGLYPTGVGASFAGDANYSASSDSNSLTVDPVPLTVTASDALKIYGEINPLFSGTITGIVNSDNITATYNSPALISSSVGTYPIIPILSDPDGKLGNYTVTIISGILTINPAALTVTANDASKVYGDPNPAFTVTYSGFAAGDDETVLLGTLTITTSATDNSPVGTYPVTPAGLSSDNYSITFVDGTLTVTAAPLTTTTGDDADEKLEDNIVAVSDEKLGVTVAPLTVTASDDADENLIDHIIAVNDETLDITTALALDDEVERNIKVAGITSFAAVEVPAFTRLSPVILISGIGIVAAGLIILSVFMLRRRFRKLDSSLAQDNAIEN